MAGHNKWSKIKHKKAITDAVKGKVYTKMAKIISVAVKEANGDLTAPSVVTAIEKAKKADVPRDNIERAIKKASDKDAAVLEPVMYEGFGPGGAGLIVLGLTDNRNRTGQEVKHVFTKNGFALGAQGSVTWGFTFNADREWEANAGSEVQLSEADEEKLANLIEAFEDLDDVTEVFTNAA